jgi:cyclophilin family peptidyl-prolyl cis-trans isomerase
LLWSFDRGYKGPEYPTPFKGERKLGVLLALGVASTLSGPTGSGGLCAGSESSYLVFVTDEGSIVAELYESAAPRTLRQLADLIRNPEPAASSLTFNYTHAHIEIYAEPLRSKESLLLPNEIDAEALGLDQVRISDAGEAMDVFQQELIPAYNRVKGGGKFHPKLREWMTKWRETMDASFLVGASRKEILEAMGYVYTERLDSRPVTKGALTLEPDSPTHAVARFGIALSDLPTRLGRQMVIGRIVEGLELSDNISTRPLDVPPGVRSLDYAPKDPIVIRSLRLECRK